MEDKKLNEQESLEVITMMINRTKERYMLGDGNIMLMWGYLIIAVTALVWITIALTHNPAANWLWFLIWIIGGTATPIMSKRQQVKQGVKSYSDKIISRMWTMVGLTCTVATAICVGFMLIGKIDVWAVMFVIGVIIVPVVEFAQGAVLNEKSFIIGDSVGVTFGLATLACMIARIPLEADWFFPMFMAAFGAMMLYPGYVLNHKARKQK